MTTPQQRQLRAAWKASGKTLVELKRAGRLKMSVVSLSRKLSGQQGLSSKEIAAIANALGVQVEITETVVTLGVKAA